MSPNKSQRDFNIVRALQKFLVSSFVVCSFLAYAIHEHAVPSESASDPGAITPTVPFAQAVPNLPQASPTVAPTARAAPTNIPVPNPTAVPAKPTSPAAPRTASQYKDGTYTGPSVDAYWGQVQVQAVIKNGQLSNVQTLKYPSDRRTSQQINRQAIPWLQSEVQAQTSNVDMISGATLTSQAFLLSLKSALGQAKGGL
jgi:uncharacterized protein with FMN-binding domain